MKWSHEGTKLSQQKLPLYPYFMISTSYTLLAVCPIFAAYSKNKASYSKFCDIMMKVHVAYIGSIQRGGREGN